MIVFIIYTGKISIDEPEMGQTNLLEIMAKFNSISWSRSIESKDNKRNTFDSLNTLYDGQELTLNAFRSGIFPIKEKQGKGLRILSPQQMLQRLPVALAQVKTDNTSENLLNKIRQIVCSMYQARKITKKEYNNIMNSIKL